jgi:hypothetical protein
MQHNVVFVVLFERECFSITMKTLRNRCIIGGMIGAVVVLGVTLSYGFGGMPDTEIAPPAYFDEIYVPMSSVNPQRIEIPSVHISTNVQHVGINEKGAIASPSNFTDAGWYKYSAQPGAQGTSIIVGHVDNALGLAGVFRSLKDVAIGDAIIITDQENASINFVVTGSKEVPYTAELNELVDFDTNTPMLTLITCSGAWIKDQQTYSYRTAIFATLKN